MITKEAIEAGVAAIDRPIHPDDVERILVAALAAMPGPAVKLEWVPIIADGRDIEAVTEFGKYTISVDSSFAGGTHYLWTPDQHEYDDDHHSEHRGMTSARAAAQADYEARIRAALTPAPDLASENERLRAALEFVTLWAWCEDPPNANRKLTDEERLSAIKYHPSIRPARAALEDHT